MSLRDRQHRHVRGKLALWRHHRQAPIVDHRAPLHDHLCRCRRCKPPCPADAPLLNRIARSIARVWTAYIADTRAKLNDDTGAV